MQKTYSITLSLAGIFQSVYLVEQLAKLGKCNESAFNICLKSILDINPDSIITIYGNKEKNLYIGLKILISILTFFPFSFSYIGLIKYFYNMTNIQNKLKNNRLKICSLKKKY